MERIGMAGFVVGLLAGLLVGLGIGLACEEAIYHSLPEAPAYKLLRLQIWIHDFLPHDCPLGPPPPPPWTVPPPPPGCVGPAPC